MATMPVVAGVDGSEESLRAVEWAALEARRHGAPLRLVSAAAMPPRMRAHGGVPQTVADELYGESVRALARGGHPSGRSHLTAAHRRQPAGRGARTRGHGKRLGSAHARGGRARRRRVRGDAARLRQQVRGHACPLPARRGARGNERGARRDRRRHRRPAGHRRDAGLRVRRGRPARCDPGRRAFLELARLRQLAPTDAEQVAAEADKNLTEALAPWRDKYPDVPVRCDVVHDHPGHVLASYTARADLVVIGRHGSAVGGIQHALLSHAHGPVAIVPRQS